MGRFIEPRVHWINICLIGRRAEDIARQKANAEGASVGGKVYLVRNTQNRKKTDAAYTRSHVAGTCTSEMQREARALPTHYSRLLREFGPGAFFIESRPRASGAVIVARRHHPAPT